MPNVHPSHALEQDRDPHPYWMCTECYECTCCSNMQKPCNPKYENEENKNA